ncbi:unnamed protein product [Caenorhabditis angaria]|uniref:Uncharacterized protein n=1 Tax=Caenorhabditis angaria TaxID=860376 RepID=A0A9P1J3U3_9PELO|nr:unnamed protein product [Caenorhabditis angaria]
MIVFLLFIFFGPTELCIHLQSKELVIDIKPELIPINQTVKNYIETFICDKLATDVQHSFNLTNRVYQVRKQLCPNNCNCYNPKFAGKSMTFITYYPQFLVVTTMNMILRNSMFYPQYEIKNYLFKKDNVRIFMDEYICDGKDEDTHHYSQKYGVHVVRRRLCTHNCHRIHFEKRTYVVHKIKSRQDKIRIVKTVASRHECGKYVKYKHYRFNVNGNGSNTKNLTVL